MSPIARWLVEAMILLILTGVVVMVGCAAAMMVSDLYIELKRRAK